MSKYVVSARKYRPTNFDAVVGQKVITDTLKNAILTKNLAQSFLFCGPRGVGKTTCARILAKQINEFNNEDNIDNFSFNIFELDAASNNSVDDIRSLTDQVRVPPQIGKYKVYIIDEVHMLSQSAFNAFLKTLEEPPKHAIFVLATTEKNKIIPTILSRCQIFDFKRVSVKDISDYLDFVAKSENIDSETSAINVIAQKSDGSMRDALSLFDRLIDFQNKTLSFQDVIKKLNILDYEYYFKLVSEINNNDFKNVLLTFNEIVNNGFDPQDIIVGLSKHLRQLLLSKDPSTLSLIDEVEDVQNRYHQQSKECEEGFLLSSLKLCSTCDLQYKNATNKHFLVELCLIQMSSINNEELKKKSDFVKIENKSKNFKQNYNLELHKQSKNSEKSSIKDKSFEQKSSSEKLTLAEESRTIVDKPNTISITSFSEKKEKKKVTEDDLEKQKENFFSEKELLEVWNNIVLNYKEKNKSNIAIIFELYKPELTNDFKIKLNVGNSSQIELINEEKKYIINFLKEHLGNDSIKLDLNVSKENSEPLAYTNKEKFQKMMLNNSSLKNLKNEFGLDPDY